MKIIFLSILVLLQIIFLTQAEARGGRGGGKSFSSHSYFSKSKSSHAGSSYRGSSSGSSISSSSECPCSGNKNCVGPREDKYCTTSDGNKRYR
ncbi:hypothetical protein FY048_03345 [Acinetobacter sp. 1124_18A]|uniref:hypothetical protein n=1 Tax=Acinetobacter sp. 1124_18A TaxID=2605958 RepID=UPI00405834C3